MRLFFLLYTILLFSCHNPPTNNSGWQLVFKNDAEGKALYGDKTALLDAVRLGYPIRIGWGSNRVEHVADADFLTIFEGKEVFAQIKPIIGQRPAIDGDSLKIHFRTNNHWVKMAGTNGFSTSLMTDYLEDTIVGGGTRYNSTTWYVNYPMNAPDITARPLWRDGSPNWEKWSENN